MSGASSGEPVLLKRSGNRQESRKLHKAQLLNFEYGHEKSARGMQIDARPCIYCEITLFSINKSLNSEGVILNNASDSMGARLTGKAKNDGANIRANISQ